MHGDGSFCSDGSYAIPGSYTLECLGECASHMIQPSASCFSVGIFGCNVLLGGQTMDMPLFVFFLSSTSR